MEPQHSLGLGATNAQINFQKRVTKDKMDAGFSAAINIQLQIVLSGMRECGGGGY